MFRVGDKVVCIRDYNNCTDEFKISKGKMYNITVSNNDYVKLKGKDDIYFSSDFISLQEYRKQKLEKINESW